VRPLSCGRFGALDLLFEQCSNNPMAVLAIVVIVDDPDDSLPSKPAGEVRTRALQTLRRMPLMSGSEMESDSDISGVSVVQNRACSLSA
jgi:hypothetical protein